MKLTGRHHSLRGMIRCLTDGTVALAVKTRCSRVLHRLSIFAALAIHKSVGAAAGELRCTEVELDLFPTCRVGPHLLVLFRQTQGCPKGMAYYTFLHAIDSELTPPPAIVPITYLARSVNVQDLSPTLHLVNSYT